MSVELFYNRYKELYVLLDEIIIESENRVLAEEPDNLFFVNVNFYIKSYLINICTYLEAYLKDVCFWYSNEVNNKIINACIPHNYVMWRVLDDNKIKDKILKFAEADFSVGKEEISDNLSANPYKTIKLFKFLGVDLTQVDGFMKNKDIISTIVNKRNNIIHHNDNAVDISFSDLRTYTQVSVEYMESICSAVSK